MLSQSLQPLHAEVCWSRQRICQELPMTRRQAQCHRAGRQHWRLRCTWLLFPPPALRRSRRQDVQNAAAEEGEGPDRQQWAEFNRRKKQDVRSWYGTKPGSRLLLLKEMLSVMLGPDETFLDTRQQALGGGTVAQGCPERRPRLHHLVRRPGCRGSSGHASFERPSPQAHASDPNWRGDCSIGFPALPPWLQLQWLLCMS